ncbi:MAG: hypothetical protein ABI838_01905 [Chloroflexota bacterium]
MIQIREAGRTQGARAFALALMAAALVALAGVGGYEIGTSFGQVHAAPAAPPHAVAGQEAPPDTGLQP